MPSCFASRSRVSALMFGARKRRSTTLPGASQSNKYANKVMPKKVGMAWTTRRIKYLNITFSQAVVVMPQLKERAGKQPTRSSSL